MMSATVVNSSKKREGTFNPFPLRSKIYFATQLHFFFIGRFLACTTHFDNTSLESQTCIWLKSTVGLIKDKSSHLFSHYVLSISTGMTTMGGWQTWPTPRAEWVVTVLIQTVLCGCKPRAPTKRTSRSPPTSRPQEPSIRSCKVRISAKPLLNSS